MAQGEGVDQVPLQLRLATITDTIGVCEPLRLVLTATVPEGETLTGWYILDPAGGRGNLTIRGPDGELRLGFPELLDPETSWELSVPPKTPLTREGGYSEGVDMWLMYQFRTSRFVFEEPGEYVIQARIAVFLGRNLDDYKAANVVSNEITVRVEDSDQRGTLRLWQTPQQVGAFLGARPPLAALLEGDGSSAYASYARWALSADEATPIAERVALLRDLLAGDCPAQLADLAFLRIAGLLLEEKDYAASRDYANQVLDLDTAPLWRKEEARKLIAAAEARLAN